MKIAEIDTPSSNKGSVILAKFMADREAERNNRLVSVKNATTDSVLVKSGDPQVIELFGGTQASSGYAVNETTAGRVSAVAACVQLIGGTIASLPLPIYEETSVGRKKIKPRLHKLLNLEPCRAWTAAAMTERWIRSIAFRGDAFSEIIRDRSGEPLRIIPRHPDRIRVTVTDDGDISYAYQPKNGNAYGIHSDDMLHIPGFGYDGETGRGMSVIKHAAQQSIGIALAADDFSGQFFRNSGMQKHLITSDSKMEADLIEKLRNEYVKKYGGGNNVGLPMILTEGLSLKEISLSSADAELLDSRKYQVIDIARAFGVPPVMIGANETTTSWGSGIEQLTLGFIKFLLKFYLIKIEQELNRKFYPNQDKFVEYNLKGLLGGDSEAEAKSLREALGGSQGPGYMTLNEVRRINNLPEVSAEQGGEKIYEPKGNTNESTKKADAAAANQQSRNRKGTAGRESD
ncbi:phage portal protein [Nitrosomonas sp.]|uniref:phage portal protein n=1 Tax=Nitrosomonas sp. TaxID=42353 RepID=UPI0025EF86E3|nr:phage portal protein [Nitrosomonas sp.]